MRSRGEEALGLFKLRQSNGDNSAAASISPTRLISFPKYSNSISNTATANFSSVDTSYGHE
jgi:hypothetical protein